MVSKVAVVKKEIEFSLDLAELGLPAELLDHPVLRSVSPRTLTALSKRFDVVRAPQGAKLFAFESAADTVYLVVAGTVRTLHRNDAGETVESAWMQEGCVLGVTEMLARTELMQETAEAVTKVVAYVVPLRWLRELAMQDAVLMANLAAALATRVMRGLMNERQLLQPALVRVAKHLTEAAAREGAAVSPGLYRVRITQDEIAAATGLNTRTVARAMKVMQSKGRVFTRRGEYLLREPMTLGLALAK